MPYSFSIDKGQRLIRLRVEGTLSADEWMTSFTAITKHPDFQGDFDHIVDINTLVADREFSAHLITRATHDRLHGKALAGARLAIIAGNHFSRAVARMYRDLVQDEAWFMIRIFDDVAGAEHWLRHPQQAA
ncbi:MAG: hypothetical protein ACPGUC_04780 [Gammaproteobacteria bacterium]